MSADWKASYLQQPGFQQRFQLMNAGQLRELLDVGMTLGAHTLSHPVLAMCSEESARHEITDSGAVIAQALGEPIPLFAFPFGGAGSVSPRDITLARAAGYDCAFMNDGGCVPLLPNLFGIPRAHISADMELGEFEAHASGFHGHFQKRLRQ
jgi:peptidoglycan/xylan/chitin deacetylase (PgdA/CDA1 family)